MQLDLEQQVHCGPERGSVSKQSIQTASETKERTSRGTERDLLPVR